MLLLWEVRAYCSELLACFHLDRHEIQSICLVVDNGRVLTSREGDGNSVVCTLLVYLYSEGVLNEVACVIN
ncbi:hypothetical protein Tsubulata_024869 [Turnera subulata]|uniref:Uncharacterized protein n=1 Tax=Turnera subulata TaxID=218843 RepID=A0A9Q0J8K3_9ROSI|nr:hypothetical protein Tsubulata_024869 [Turnera subulata]